MADPWGNDWKTLEDAAFSQTAGLAVTSRYEGNMECFAMGPDGMIRVRAYNPPKVDPSIRLRAIVEVGEGRFIEVIGTGFSPERIATISSFMWDTVTPTSKSHREDTVRVDIAGNFTDRIKVGLGGDLGGAQAEAKDVATGMTAESSI
jgi:hypothetical protein